MLDDFLIAYRRMVRSKGSSLAVILLLATALGASACMFAVANGLLWKPLPYPHSDRLVSLDVSSGKMGIPLGWSIPYLDQVLRRTSTLASVAGYRSGDVALVDDRGGFTGSTRAITAQPSIFRMLGLQAVQGRLLVDDDTAKGAAPVAVIGWELWSSRYGAATSAVGSTIRVSGRDHLIVGVLPRESGFPSGNVQLWLPLELSEASRDPRNAGSFGDLRAMALMRPGVRALAVDREMMQLARGEPTLKSIADHIALKLEAVPLRRVWVGDREQSVKSMLLATLMVFAVTLANVCNLFMLRLLWRRQESAMLQALGADRLRRMRQLLFEAAMLSGLAAVLALMMAPLGLSVLRHFDILPADLPVAVGIDAATLVLLSAMTAVVAGLLAACSLLFGTQSVYEVLRQTGNGQTASRSAHRAREVLVVVQITMTLVLLLGTALLMRSSHNLLAQEIGFQREGRLVGTLASLDPGDESQYPLDRSRLAQWASEVAALPGVAAVGMASSAPFGDVVSVAGFRRPGTGNDAPDQQPSAYVSFVSPGYFRALGLPVRRGRAFTDEEARSAAPVSIVDEELARNHFGTEDPIGRTLTLNQDAGVMLETTVVGVVGVIRQRTLFGRDEYPSVYVPETVPYRVRGIPSDGLEVVIRGSAPEALARGLPARLERTTRTFRFTRLVTLQERVADTIIDRLRLNGLLQILGAIALVLTAVGLYATLFYMVTMRYREFGIRKALGASAERLMVDVLRKGARLMAISFALALPLSFALGRLLEPRLFGVSAIDPLSLAAVFGIFAVVGLAANAWPAYRASRASPMDALRSS